ncbi:MAG: NmrA family NAD(P)-binding protein [Alphaproteobacteria bacterium]
MDVLVTGAGGRTGQYIVPVLVGAGHRVRFVTRQANYDGPLLQHDATPITADLGNDADVARAMTGAEAVYHIPPNMNPDEIAFGKRIIAAAEAASVKHFVYHSVLHPQVQGLTHHWNKVFVEEALIESGLAYTILQPTSYMQMVAGDWEGISQRGVHTLAFSPKARLSLVDLEDVGAAAAIVLGNPDHFYAIYELGGPAMLSCEDKARILSEVLGHPVRAGQDSLDDFRAKAKAAGMPAHIIETRARMFDHYDHNGLSGNGNVLGWLLGRPPNTFDVYVRRELLPLKGR